MIKIPGTRGYEKAIGAFIAASQSLSFSEVNKDFLEFLPTIPGSILDAGAGVGQNAAALSQLGHSVVAVEPFPPFLEMAQSTYKNLGIDWVADSLPRLEKLNGTNSQFDFILVDGVWHHLNEEERKRGMARFSSLMRCGGHCAISLRHGPAGIGTHLFPTNGQDTVDLAYQFGLTAVLHLTNQPSLIKNKHGVIWTRICLKKQSSGNP